MSSEHKAAAAASINALVYTFGTQTEETGIAALLKQVSELGIEFKDLHSSERSLEEIFVNLVHAGKPAEPIPKECA